MADEETKAADAVEEEPTPPPSSEETTTNDSTVESYTSTMMLSLPTATPMTQVQSSLLTTLNDLNVRSEVEDCLNGMLMDVETAHSLRQQLELKAQEHTIHTLHQQQEATVLEADAERRFRTTQQAALADKMVQELLALSQEMEGLLQWKKENEEKVQGYDELLAKLMQTEEELQEAQRVQYSDGPKPRRPEESPSKKETPTKAPRPVEPVSSKPIESSTTGSATETAKVETTAAVDIASVVEDRKPTARDDAKQPATDLTATEVAATQTAQDDQDGTLVETATEAVVKERVESSMEEMTDGAAKASNSAAHVAVVSLDEEESEEEAPGLVDVDVEILMAIFGFIDAMDILNMAQINLTMYNKIDNIFGISEDGQSPPQPTPPTPAPAPRAPPPAPKPVPATSASVATSNSAPSTVAAAAAAATTPIGNRLFSMLQPVARPAGGSGAATKKPSLALNPSDAQSMASKLSDAEVAAILSMTDKLNKIDKEVTILRNEKEVLTAKLDGTEAVKQFLINKVRDVEVKLTLSRDDEIKVTQQISSDQEVIAFLDSRVQELERQTETLTKDKSLSQSELETIKVQTSKKITMLTDMLKYEREKLKEEEGEWKATKKVLVKEVKSCRAQILALQAERDGLKEQNEMLRRAIVSTGKSPMARSTSPMR